jgi:proline iminopeptidase
MNTDEFTIKECMLPVSSKHTLYIQEWGNANALDCIIFLHGGPGTGCKDSAKQLFDPRQHRVIFFDQRGAGKSVPHGLLQRNTTSQLVSDISRVADFFNVQQFVLVGGSWGSTLALCYAIAEPERVMGMSLRGIFLGTKAEIDFIEKGLFRDFFPDAWQTFLARTPDTFQADPMAFHIPRILGANKQAQRKSAFAVDQLQVALSSLITPQPSILDDAYDPTKVIIETHFTANHCFLERDYIVTNAKNITAPTSIIQGRYDFVCPPRTAITLANALPNATLKLTAAGHSPLDPENHAALQTDLRHEFWNR